MNQPRSVKADVNKLIEIRKRLALTQEEVSRLSGYSERLIRKLESGGSLRPKTLKEVLQCYHEALGIDSWSLDEFIQQSQTNLRGEVLNANECPNCKSVREYFRTVYCDRQPEKVGEFCCENVRFTGEGSSRSGIAVIRQRAEALLNAFDPIEFEFERIHSIDDIVYSSWISRLKHAGVFLEIPPTGRWVEIRGTTITQFADGLAVESEDNFDVDSIVRQLTGQAPRII